MSKNPLSLLVSLVFCAILTAGTAVADETAKRDLSQELRELVAEHSDLAAALEAGFADQRAGNCPHCCDGKSSYWHGKDLEDFYAFVAGWQTHPPRYGKTLGQYNCRFADYVTSPRGYLAVQVPLFRSWMIDFQNARKAFLETPASAVYVEEFIREAKIDLEDYVVPKSGKFDSFVEFFIRELRPGARPFVDRANACVLNSPIDATFALTSSIIPGSGNEKTLSAKGDILSIREVFNNHPSASRFLGGTALTFWLEYTNTHWFYTPVDGVVVAADVIAGLYGKEYAYENLPAHKRGYVILETEKFGLVGMLVVGLQTVSEIDLKVKAGDAVQKGEPLGHFNYGGSTAILFYEPGKAKLAFKLPDDDNRELLVGEKLLLATDPSCR